MLESNFSSVISDKMSEKITEIETCEMVFTYTMSPHSGGTETKVKEIVSDIPPHTNQNIGIF